MSLNCSLWVLSEPNSWHKMIPCQKFPQRASSCFWVRRLRAVTRWCTCLFWPPLPPRHSFLLHGGYARAKAEQLKPSWVKTQLRLCPWQIIFRHTHTVVEVLRWGGGENNCPSFSIHNSQLICPHNTWLVRMWRWVKVSDLVFKSFYADDVHFTSELSPLQMFPWPHGGCGSVWKTPTVTH